MEYARLAEELVVSRVGFGACPLGGHGWGGDFKEEEGVAAVQRAWDSGVNFFDTADVYGLGKSEKLLSQALGKHRHSAVIASKFGVRWDSAGNTYKDLSLKYLRSALEASLERLQLEYIPLYYVHWPDLKIPIEDVIGELQRCREEGKIGAIGVSNFSAEQLEVACRVAPISALQVQYSLVDREHVEQILPVAKRYGVPLVTWGSLAQGLLTGKFNANNSFALNDRRHRYDNFLGEKYQSNLRLVEVVQQVADRIGKTPAQVAMRWLLDSPGVACVLFGSKRPSQVSDNVGAVDWSLDQRSYRELDSAFSVAKQAVA